MGMKANGASLVEMMQAKQEHKSLFSHGRKALQWINVVLVLCDRDI